MPKPETAGGGQRKGLQPTDVTGLFNPRQVNSRNTSLETFAPKVYALSRLSRAILFINMIAQGLGETGKVYGGFTGTDTDHIFAEMQGRPYTAKIITKSGKEVTATNTRGLLDPLVAAAIVSREEKPSIARAGSQADISVYSFPIDDEGNDRASQLSNLQQQVALAGAMLIFTERFPSLSTSAFIAESDNTGVEKISTRYSLNVIHAIAQEIKTRRELLGNNADIGEIEGTRITELSGLKRPEQVLNRLSNAGLFERRVRAAEAGVNVDYFLPIRDEYPVYPEGHPTYIKQTRGDVLSVMYRLFVQNPGTYFSSREIFDYLKVNSETERAWFGKHGSHDEEVANHIENNIRKVVAEWVRVGALERRGINGISLNEQQEANLLFIDELLTGIMEERQQAISLGLAKAAEYAVFPDDPQADIKHARIASFFETDIQGEEINLDTAKLQQGILSVIASQDADNNQIGIIVRALRQIDSAYSQITPEVISPFIAELVANGRIRSISSRRQAGEGVYEVAEDSVQNYLFLAELLEKKGKIHPELASKFLRHALSVGAVFTSRGEVAAIFVPRTEKYAPLTSDNQIYSGLRRVIRALLDDKSSISPEQAEGRNFVLVKSEKARAGIKTEYGDAVRYVFNRKNLRYASLQQAIKQVLKNAHESIGSVVSEANLILAADSIFKSVSGEN